MAKILINDGMDESSIQFLRDNGHTVDTDKISQEDLNERLKDYDAICVRSATKVRKSLIDLAPQLKLIGRGGVGMDNIDVDYARSKGIHVINTPAASSRSVAELAFAHLFAIARYIYNAGQNMPSKGHNDFDALKKSYSKGFELEGKTLGIIGMGRIGQEAAKIGLGLGMKIIASDPFVKDVTIHCQFADKKIDYNLPSSSLADLLSKSDVITLHVPFTGKAIISEDEFKQMKKGAILINASRGGTVDEDAMISALNSGILAAAGVDVFDNEPTPREDILKHAKVCSTPHIGASTHEAQEKIGMELAQQIHDLLA